jgi:hypothetical protein
MKRKLSKLIRDTPTSRTAAVGGADSGGAFSLPKGALVGDILRYSGRFGQHGRVRQQGNYMFLHPINLLANIGFVIVVADSVPRFDVRPTCRSAINMMGSNPARTVEHCVAGVDGVWTIRNEEQGKELIGHCLHHWRLQRSRNGGAGAAWPTIPNVFPVACGHDVRAPNDREQRLIATTHFN